MPAAPTATPEQIKDVNTRYHDAAAAEYDAKWGIDFGDDRPASRSPRSSARRSAASPEPFGDALEIGAGTGYFTLNLAQLGLIERPTATDISPGMLATLERSAATLGVEVETVETEAERLPFADGASTSSSGTRSCTTSPISIVPSRSFTGCCARAATLAFCGEPSRYGDRIAAVPKRIGLAAAPAWRRLVGASPARWLIGAEPATATSSSRRSTCTPSRPASCGDFARRARLGDDPGPRRGAGRERLRLAAAHARGDRRARRGPGRLAQLRLPQLHRAAAGRHRRCSSRACRHSSSTTSCSAPGARSDPSSAASDGAAIIAPACASCS